MLVEELVTTLPLQYMNKHLNYVYRIQYQGHKKQLPTIDCSSCN